MIDAISGALLTSPSGDLANLAAEAWRADQTASHANSRGGGLGGLDVREGILRFSFPMRAKTAQNLHSVRLFAVSFLTG